MLKLFTPLKKLASAAQCAKDVNNESPCAEIPQVVQAEVERSDMYLEFYPIDGEEGKLEQLAPCRLGSPRPSGWLPMLWTMLWSPTQ